MFSLALASIRHATLLRRVAEGHDSDLVLTSFWTSFFPPVDITQLCGKCLFSLNCIVWLDSSCCRCGSCCWFLLASDGFCLLLLASACSCCFLPTAAVFCWIFFGCDFSGPVVGGVPCRKGDGSKVGGTSGFRCSSGYNAGRRCAPSKS